MRILLIFLVFSIQLNAQEVRLYLTFNGENLELNKPYYHEKLKDTVQISKLQFYLSNISIEHEDGNTTEIEKKHHLIDLQNPQSHKIHFSHLRNKGISKLIFNLGIDSLTSVSGAFGGDLDPTKGMYWSWQSGYINFKLEGLTTQRKTPFQYHLGGYSFPFNTLSAASLTLNAESDVELELPVDKIISQLLLNNGDVLSPSDVAVELSERIVQTFREYNEN